MAVRLTFASLCILFHSRGARPGLVQILKMKFTTIKTTQLLSKMSATPLSIYPYMGIAAHYVLASLLLEYVVYRPCFTRKVFTKLYPHHQRRHFRL
jgi:hypothetical protein